MRHARARAMGEHVAGACPARLQQEAGDFAVTFDWEFYGLWGGHTFAVTKLAEAEMQI